jgi:hypothetical protein
MSVVFGKRLAQPAQISDTHRRSGLTFWFYLVAIFRYGELLSEVRTVQLARRLSRLMIASAMGSREVAKQKSAQRSFRGSFATLNLASRRALLNGFAVVWRH